MSKIHDEALRFLNANKDRVATPGGYTSPRVSSEIPDCSMPLTFDQYTYCALGCLYCFAYTFKSTNPAYTGREIPLGAINVQKMLDTMKGKYPDDPKWKCFYSRRFLLHWGGLADPFCGFEKKNRVGLELMRGLAEMKYPTLLSFKGPTIMEPEYLALLRKYAKNRSFAFQSSIITNSDELSKQIEVGVPTTTQRLAMMKTLSNMGYWTILRLRPFIIGLSDDGLLELLERARDAGARAISCEFFAMDSRCSAGVKDRYDWIAQLVGVKDLHEYFHRLSPSERGGYMRLNRLVKEPYIKTIYKFCAENDMVCGISDPDFKELNTSGSCCGMPDEYPANPEMCNWTHNQLTYHLKELRRQYHRTGVCGTIRFNDVYPDSEPYLTDRKLGQDNVSTIGTPNAERALFTQKLGLQERWNNLNSPACPRNYLHGKVMPDGVDNEGNLIYRYHVHPYETQWAAEGIDMTR